MRFEPTLQFVGKEPEFVIVGEPTVRMEGFLKGRRVYPPPLSPGNAYLHMNVYYDHGIGHKAPQPGDTLPTWITVRPESTKAVEVTVDQPGQYVFVCKAGVELSARPGNPKDTLHSAPQKLMVQ